MREVRRFRKKQSGTGKKCWILFHEDCAITALCVSVLCPNVTPGPFAFSPSRFFLLVFWRVTIAFDSCWQTWKIIQVEKKKSSVLT